MELAELVTYTVVLALATIVVHETLHYVAAKTLRYNAKLFVTKYLSIGFNIPDNAMKLRDAVAITLMPQTITVAYIILAQVSYVFTALAISHILASIYDFIELYNFSKKRRQL